MQDYKVISIGDIIEYVDCSARRHVLDTFSQRDFSLVNKYIKSSIPFKILAYIDCVVSFPQDFDTTSAYLASLFPENQKLLNRYLIINRPVDQIVKEIRKLHNDLQQKDLELSKIPSEAKIVYTLLSASQPKYYNEQKWIDTQNMTITK